MKMNSSMMPMTQSHEMMSMTSMDNSSMMMKSMENG